MTRTKKISITVATVVHNKEKRITSFLNNLASQNQDHFKLKKILIFSDGSTDRTIEEVKKNNDKRVELIVGRKNLGRTRRLNEIFQASKTDILVLLDIDSAFKDRYVIENLVAPFQYRRDIALVGGNPKPLPPNNFLENAAQNYYQARELLKRTINEGNNIYGVDKRILALSKSFIEKVKIPKDIDNDDTFIYMKCRDEKMEFVHQEQAIVWFRLPQNIRDHLKYLKKKSEDIYILRKKFSKDLITQEFEISRDMKIKLFFYQFINNPPGYLMFLPLSIYTIVKEIVENVKKNTKLKKTRFQKVPSLRITS